MSSHAASIHRSSARADSRRRSKHLGGARTSASSSTWPLSTGSRPGRGRRLLHRLGGAHERVQARAATRVWVSLRVDDDMLLLSIRDDGVGGAHASRGSGLTGLRDRIEALGGTFRIESPTGSGTLIEVEIPIVGPADPDGEPDGRWHRLRLSRAAIGHREVDWRASVPAADWCCVRLGRCDGEACQPRVSQEPKEDSMPQISRGFRGRRPQVDATRLPPGQYVTTDFPVLSAGPTPHTPLDEWTFSIPGAVDERVSWTWEELLALPAETPTVDIHCVTKWSSSTRPGRASRVDTLLGDVETDGRVRRGLLRRRLHDQPAARRPHRRPGMDRLRVRRRAARRPSTAARRGCWCRTCTSGRAPSGCAASSSMTTTSRASGRRTATTTTATPGRSSATRATDDKGEQGGHKRGRANSSGFPITSRAPRRQA